MDKKIIKYIAVKTIYIQRSNLTGITFAKIEIKEIIIFMTK